ncbi:hypothetical protein EDB85DRAFT_2213593 [Lactarius pseudohatsudake]|nr:hypothetical protein EDB85DRAFT_2213593 [Lactarius pseudohatsudake]
MVGVANIALLFGVRGEGRGKGMVQSAEGGTGWEHEAARDIRQSIDWNVRQVDRVTTKGLAKGYGYCTRFGTWPNVFKFHSSRGPSSSRHPGRGRFNPRQEPPLDSPRDAEPQGGPSQLRVDVTVLRADNLPKLNNIFGLKFFVTVASQATEKKTPSVPAKRQTARWGESLGAFLYAKRKARQNTLIGTHEMIPVESQTDTPFVLTGDGQAGESVTLYLTVNVSPNTTSDPISPSTLPLSNQPQSTTRLLEKLRSPLWPRSPRIPLDPPSPPALKHSHLLPIRLPSEMSTPIPPAADRRGVSPAESALHGTDEAIATINLSNKWEGALGRIKWVMDTVSPVAEPNFVLSITRTQRWHMVYFLRSPR